MMTQTEIMMALEHVGVRVVGTTQEFGTGGNGVWISAEDTPDLFSYWSPKWINGIKPELNKLMEACGWYFEWHDEGTMMAYPNV